jgi:hypothetical protein
VDVSSSEMKEGYYRPFNRLFEEFSDRTRIQTVAGEEFQVISLENADLVIGRKADEMVDARQTARPSQSRIHGEGRLAVGGDGIMVELGPSWSEENMRLEPQSRLPASGGEGSVETAS